MGADLKIHVMADEMSEEDLRCFNSSTLGSKYFSWIARNKCLTNSRESQMDCQHWKKVMESPSVWIGEVSWLKAAVLEDSNTFVPNPVEKVSEAVGEDLPEITEALIGKVAKAMGLKNKTSYSISNAKAVIDFLKKYKGKKVFTVSW